MNCSGEEVGVHDGLHVINCKAHGYAHLHPLPSDGDQARLYSHFWDTEKPGAWKKIQEDKPWRWRNYEELLERVEGELDGPRSCLDVGCGLGDFMEFMAHRPGWRIHGVDPDHKARMLSSRWGVVWPRIKRMDYTLVTMNQVLEHLLEPRIVLEEVYKSMAPNGLLLVSVPNDFTNIQKWASRRVGRQWWIHRHHVNYFGFESMEKLLRRCGFEPIHRTTSFPMELFLFLTDYTKKASTGRRLHRLRKLIDPLFPYPWMARKGIGRHVVFLARKT